jgi:hypothetical protein
MTNLNLSKKLSVIVVSDYEDRPQKSWETEKLILKALANQDATEKFDVVLVENDKERDHVPESLYQILPDVKIIFCPYSQSAQLKDYGCKEVDTEFIAVLEADCIPCARYLMYFMSALTYR